MAARHRSITSLISGEWKSLAQNAIALYAVLITTYLLPLITIPYLARVLGPAPWGLVAMAQALSAYLMIVVEYGFHLSATRAVARERENRDRLADLFANVLSAKGVLALVLLPVPLLVRGLVPALGGEPQLLWAAYVAAVALALTPSWFFQGLELMRLVGVLDIVARAIATFGIFAFVRGPGDAALVLWLQAIGGLVAGAIGFGLAARVVRLRRPRWTDAVHGFRLGRSLFVFRLAVSMYTAGNALILGMFVPARLVGYYAGAERVTRAFQGVLGPISQVLYPRMSYLVKESPEGAARLLRSSQRMTGTVGFLLYLLAAIGAPMWVGVLLGDQYGPSIPVLRILALVIPLIALSNALGIQWMLPLGLDRGFNWIIAVAGILNVGLAIVLAPGLGPVGMATAVVVSEMFVTVGMCSYLRIRRQNPGVVVAETTPGI
ncbi:MAG: flippase [Armatimonadota bacterium]|nr:flippase [Armatimonadota bacterium]